MSKRELAAGILGNPLACQAVRRPQGLRVLAYHRVRDDDPRYFPFDEALISATAEAFYEQMKFVSRNFEVISFEDLHQCELEGRRWPRRALIITFDDGYRDNYTNAFPILKEMGLPATVFLTTGHIGGAKLFWWDQVAYLFKHTVRRSVLFPEICPERFDLTGGKARRQCIDQVLCWLKQVEDEARQSFIQSLAATLDVALPVADRMHLSWEEVEEMAGSGIEFGSHTVTHPILSHVGEARLREEISGSRKNIEGHLGREVIAFAYPAGRRTRFNNNVQSVVAESGYRFAVSYEEGVAVEGECDRFAMPRIHVEREQSLSLFRANLIFPKLMLAGGRFSDAGKESIRPGVPSASL